MMFIRRDQSATKDSLPCGTTRQVGQCWHMRQSYCLSFCILFASFLFVIFLGFRLVLASSTSSTQFYLIWAIFDLSPVISYSSRCFWIAIAPGPPHDPQLILNAIDCGIQNTIIGFTTTLKLIKAPLMLDEQRKRQSQDGESRLPFPCSPTWLPDLVISF